MEAQLIQRCKDGDLDAFEGIYKKYGDRIYGMCLRMSKNRETAEDLVQEVFILLIRKIKSFRGDSKFSTWLYRISVNTCLSYLRKQKSKKETTEGFADASALQKASSPDVVHREALKKAIADLPEGYRASVVLHDIQGYSHKEIGTMLGITEGASKSQLFKARRKLREVVAVWENKAMAGSMSQ